MTKRNRLLVVLAAVMAFAIAAAFLLFNPAQTAFAERSSTAWTTIGEIYNDSTKAFNEDNLKKLYKALTGTDTFASVQTAADSGKTSADFRTTNVGSNNVSVWFGGKKWDAVYLTTAQNGGDDTQKGDVILDLWQSADTVTTRAKFGYWNIEEPDLTDIYPKNLYSSSQIRVETLNAGGKYSTSDTALDTHGQDAGNQYARFTMSSVANSLTAYIATPAQVGYQEKEFNADTAKSISKQSNQAVDKTNGNPYYLPNDAYGTPSGGQWFNEDFGKLYTEKDSSRESEAKYGAWQNDYLWLPSITEVGCSADANGLWSTDISLRSSVTVNDGYVDEGSYAWLRSGFCSPERYKSADGQKIYGYPFVYVMGVNPGSDNHADWTNSVMEMNLVRPALHLNLSAVNGNVKSAWKSVGEIYNDGSSSFNRDNMQALYTALTGAPSYGDVRTALSKGNKTSADFREKNGGQNVQVTFGGIKWDAVYLTKAKNGDFILDLWQSADSVTKTSKWANRNVSSGDARTDDYPSDMYSTSLIRVQTLNAGGYMSTSGSQLAEKTEQSTGNEYARFTMSSANKSLVQYIVQPKDVAYQETENAVGNSSSSYTLSNDAYGTPSSSSWFNDLLNYAGKGTAHDESKYEAWQEDYLWLPSLAETGDNDTANQNGLWKTDVFLRSAVSKNGESYAWLRSGYCKSAVSAYYLDTLGGSGNQSAHYESLVRPALHLNLTAINNSLKKVVNAPEIKSLTYTGNELKPDISDTQEYTVESNVGGVEVGTYDVELQLKSPDDYKWADEEPNKEFKLLKYEITTATNEWTGGGVTVDGGGWTYGDTVKLSAPSKFGTATYTYYNDKNGVADTSPLGAQPTNAGTYWVKATVAALKSTKDTSKNNYDELVSEPVRFEIKKAELEKPTGTATVEETYSGSPYVIEVSGYNDKMTAELSDDTKSSFVSGKFTATKAGEYTLTITITDQSNYMWTDGNSTDEVIFTIKIAKKELEKPEGSANGAYNGEDYVVTLTNYDNVTMKTSDAPEGSTFEQKGGKWQFSARDVGTYSITISLRYPDNYKWIGEGADPVITITIGKTELSFTLKESRKTYTGLPHSDIDVNFDGDFGHLTKDSDYTLSFAAIDGVLDGGLPKGAGSYTVTLTLKGTTAQDYDLKVATATYEIVKADLTFSLKQATATYTGSKHEDIDVNFTGIQNEEEFTKGTHYTLSFAVQSDTTARLDGTLPKTVGKYTVTVTLLGERDKNYNITTVSQTYEINKAQITVSGEYSDSRDYNGENYEQTITVAGESNGLTVTMPINDPEFEITIATDKSAKTYTGNIKVEYDKVNFALTNSGTYTVTINKAELTLTLTVVGGGKPYDGYDTATVTGEITKGIFNSDDVTIAEIIANFNDKNVGENKPITVTEVTLGGAMADNYKVVIADLPEIKGKIDKETVEVVWSGYENLVYDGNPQTITASATGVMIDGHAEEITLSIEYSAEAGSTLNESDLPQNAGSYTATASTSNGNYALSGNTKTYTVAKQQVAAPTIASKVYNRAPQTADIEQSELYEVTENDGGTDVDNYNVKLTLTDSKNYAWTTSDEAEIVLIFTITKATYDMSGVTFEDFSIIYDGEEHSIFISGALPFEEVTVRYENNGQTAVGEYTVTAIFTGDAHNYELIPEKTATLTILKVVHDLSNIIFADVKVKYDGEAHGIYIEGELPTNVTVTYEGNGQVEPNIYTITAIFSDPDGVFDTKEATLTILRTQTQTAPKEESSSEGSSSSSGSGETGGEGGSSGESGANAPEVLIESEEGFDPTLELVVEKVEDVERNYLAWGADEVSQKYAVKLYNRDGEEVPIEGKVTVRLLIPEAFRNKDFDLMAMAKAGAASANDGVQTIAISAMTGATSVTFTRDGNYVVFEADGLSDYVFTSSYTPYFPIIIAATGVLLVDVAAMIALAVVIKKKLHRRAR